VAISEREQLSLLSVIRIADCPRLPVMSVLSVEQIGPLGLARQHLEAEPNWRPRREPC